MQERSRSEGLAEGTLQAAAERSVLAPFPMTGRGERAQDIHLGALRAIETQRWMLEAHILEG